ncbi:putative transcription factor SBP family [Helianthus anomalus]
MEWNSKWDWENHDIFGSKAVAVSSPKKVQSSEDIDGSFNLSGVVNFPDNTYNNKINGNFPSFEASVCSSDQSIGLKFGKRTYFENGFASSDSKTCSISTVKKVKISNMSMSVSRCQVEGCNLDLLYAKEYHKKHRVCGNHSKALKVVVAGLERRFCQQCSRYAFYRTCNYMLESVKFQDVVNLTILTHLLINGLPFFFLTGQMVQI